MDPRTLKKRGSTKRHATDCGALYGADCRCCEEDGKLVCRPGDAGTEANRPTREQLRALWDACVKWRDDHRVICAESIYQTDRVNLACPELATAVCGIIGYAEVEDE